MGELGHAGARGAVNGAAEKDMKQQSPNIGNQTAWQRSARAWDRFWFTPADPTVLGAIRICCGVITLYTTRTESCDEKERVRTPAPSHGL